MFSCPRPAAVRGRIPGSAAPRPHPGPVDAGGPGRCRPPAARSSAATALGRLIARNVPPGRPGRNGDGRCLRMSCPAAAGRLPRRGLLVTYPPFAVVLFLHVPIGRRAPRLRRPGLVPGTAGPGRPVRPSGRARITEPWSCRAPVVSTLSNAPPGPGRKRHPPLGVTQNRAWPR